MNGNAHDAYLNTRVSGKATQLYQPGDLQRFTQLGLPELAQEFGLTALFEEQRSVRGRSRAVEQTLMQALMDDVTVLVRSMNAEERGLVLAWARQFALFNLKTLLRGKIRQLDQQEIRENLYDLPPRVRLANEDLFRTENAVELLRCLEDGPLSLLARQAREIYEKRQESFALEAAIDQRYYTDLARRVTRLEDSVARRQMRRLVGALVDRANVLWLLRFRFGYRLSSSETFYQLVPSPHLLHRERLLALVGLDAEAKILAALPEPLHSRLADAGNLMEIQRRLGHYCAEVAWLVLRGGQSGVARALAYLILREFDLRLAFTLFQGRLLKLPEPYVELALGLSPAICVHQWREAA
ncbi:V0D/AC39 family V-type ATPase subunit [Thioalkalivibrio paradoxus]|uniref:ATPase n=1 Tax=Thioalkalivibrio paradoxus ARh 1 TaxID=713585 RepID=W0DMH9_9GAMM|nr:V-type ATPase subunit [Thioalkalivibrio paradoxus]AHE99789.1 ATPase [Thioalkalivibrio paradoxus ARh 1]